MMALFVACKTQSKVVPLVIRDSISITYKQGIEQPASIDARGAATPGASVFEGLLSQRTNKSAVPMIRVDTVFVERWHTQYLPEPPKPIPRFYKDCTWGFFILLLLIIGRIALRITKAVCLRR